jgi:hypothetical protein
MIQVTKEQTGHLPDCVKALAQAANQKGADAGITADGKEHGEPASGLTRVLLRKGIGAHLTAQTPAMMRLEISHFTRLNPTPPANSELSGRRSTPAISYAILSNPVHERTKQMSQTQPILAVGDRVRLMNTKIMDSHGIGGSIGTIVPLSSEHSGKPGAVAVSLLTGPKAYECVVVPASSVSPHSKACYWCKNRTPTNNRDVVKCLKHGRDNASAGTCEHFAA